MNEFICVVDDDKSINFELLEEQYGSELVKGLKIDLEVVQEKNYEWRLEILEENKHWITFVFVTCYFSDVYSVWKERKSMKDKYLIGSIDCKKLNDLMDSFAKETVSNG